MWCRNEDHRIEGLNHEGDVYRLYIHTYRRNDEKQAYPGTEEIWYWEEPMAEAIRNGRTALLRLSGKLFAAVLSLVGVLSGCGNPHDAPAYGPPSAGLDVCGQICSASDSSLIAGIEVKLTSTDSLSDFSVNTTDSNGNYNLNMGAEYYPWPDSVRLVAADIDGEQNGSFLSRDTLISLDSLENPYDFIYIDVMDLFLEEATQ